MKKVFCEVVLKGTDGINRKVRCCGTSKENAENKLLKEFENDKIVSTEVLEEYDEADYGWC